MAAVAASAFTDVVRNSFYSLRKDNVSLNSIDPHEYLDVEPHQISGALMKAILKDLEEHAQGVNSQESSAAPSSSTGALGAGEWAGFVKNGAFFTRHVKDRDGDITRERIRLWCDGSYISWCDAKLPKNMVDPEKQIHVRKVVELFQGSKPGSQLYTDKTPERHCFTVRSSKITLSVEADSFEDRQMWWNELKRYMKKLAESAGGDSGPSTPSRRGSVAPSSMDRRPSLAPGDRRQSMAPGDSSTPRRSSMAAGSSSAAAAAQADREAKEEAEAKAERDRIRASRPVVNNAVKDLAKGSNFVLFARDQGEGITDIPVTLFWVQDALHAPPGAVYWVEQENPTLETFPDRRLDVKNYVRAVRGKEAPEFSAPAAREAAPTDCVSLIFAEDRQLHLLGTAMTIKLWVNALQALQLASQAENMGKKEARTQRQEDAEVQNFAEERKQLDEVNQKNGFAQGNLKAEEMLVLVKKMIQRCSANAKAKNKEDRPRLFDKLKALKSTAPENHLNCMPPRSASELTKEMSWYQTIMDVKYGMRMCAINALAEKDEVDPDDFSETKTLHSFSGIGPDMMPKRNEYVSVEFKDYAPKVFVRLRTHFGIGLGHYIEEISSIELVTHVVTSKKSDSFYWMSRNGEFLVKGVKEEHFKFFLSWLPKYYDFIVNTDGDSFITRIYGLHRIRNSQNHEPVYLVVMKNIFWGPSPPQVRYELKGSKGDREASDGEKSGTVKVLKDKDFQGEEKQLFLRPAQKEFFLEQLRRDVDFLTSVKAMDYCFHIGVYNKTGNHQAATARSIRALYGLRDRDVEYTAKNEDASTMDDDEKDVLAQLEQEVPIIDAMEINDLAKVSNWTMDNGGIASAAWDRRRKRYYAADEMFYCGITGIFQEFNMKKSWESWWKRKDEGRSCVEPQAYGDRMHKMFENVINFENDTFIRKKKKEDVEESENKAADKEK